MPLKISYPKRLLVVVQMNACAANANFLAASAAKAVGLDPGPPEPGGAMAVADVLAISVVSVDAVDIVETTISGKSRLVVVTGRRHLQDRRRQDRRRHGGVHRQVVVGRCQRRMQTESRN